MAKQTRRDFLKASAVGAAACVVPPVLASEPSEFIGYSQTPIPVTTGDLFHVRVSGTIDKLKFYTSLDGISWKEIDG